MKKETIVYIRNGSPWITENCPACGTHVYNDDNFCSECGQELSHAHYRMILETGGVGLKMHGGWTQCIPDNEGVNRAVFVRELEKLERICQVHPKDETMLEIMREAYIRNCFGKEKEV